MKQVIPTIDHINVDANVATATDPWDGISEDVIRRFFDVLCIEQGVPKGMLPAYRADLDAFDRWLIGAKHKTLISATGEDVREYLDVSMSCIRAFYGFLVNAGCRDDDPTKATPKSRRRRSRRN
jgi:site-specific recombinase XerD